MKMALVADMALKLQHSLTELYFCSNKEIIIFHEFKRKTNYLYNQHCHNYQQFPQVTKQ